MTAPAAASTNAEGNRIYPIPHPDTGEIVDLPNISSILDVLQAFGLADWKLRMAAVGLAMSSDLAASVVAHHHDPAGPPRNRAIKTVIEDAIDLGQRLEPGRGFLANDFGSAIHLLTEHIDAGLVDVTNLPATVAEHAAHYVDLMAGHGIEVVHSEATVVNYTHGYAGTGDRITRFAADSPHLGIPEGFDALDLGRGCFWLDIKTGSVHKKFAMQLAALANAEAIWDAETRELTPLPADLRRDIGFALHLTAGGAALIPVELDQGWPAFVAGVTIKAFVDSDPLGQPLVAPIPADAPSSASTTEGGGVPADPVPLPNRESGGVSQVPASRTPLGSELVRQVEAEERLTHISTPLEANMVLIKRRWLIDRITKLSDHAKAQAADFWNAQIPDVPTFRASGTHTLEQLEQIETVINAAEREVTAPFPEPDPSKVEPKLANNDPRRLALIERLRALPPDLLVAIEASNREHKVPRLTDTTAHIFPSHLDLVEGWVASAETEYAPRAQTISDLLGLLGEKDVPVWDVLTLLGVDELRKITEDHTLLLSDLVDAVNLGIVSHHVDGWDVDQPAVTALFDDKRDLLTAGKQCADRFRLPKPIKATDVTADPLMAASVSMTAAASVAV